jgi:hypothetical protein
MPTRHDFTEAMFLSNLDHSFATLVWALLLKADTMNTEKIAQTWPDLTNEFVKRYNAPGGYLPGETEKKKGD